MTMARPTAASAAAIAIAKIATMTPVGRADAGANRQNAMKLMFAAASIISIPIKINIAWLRLRAARRPTENKQADITRKSWRVGVIAKQLQALKELQSYKRLRLEAFVAM